MKQYLKTVFNPIWYQGHGKKRPYFEGWYFKLIDAQMHHRYAIIPGVFLSNEPHAFIQVLDGVAGKAWYHQFPLDTFWAAEDRFEVHIGANCFSERAIVLNIDTPEQQIRGELQFDDTKPWPVTLAEPGIMGWYAWVPTMECYHGVASLDHTIYGSLTINGRSLDFTNGRGYIEKDWGQSFPSAWIWMQTNHFETVGTSLTASVAMIPWRSTQFRGFIVGFWHEQQLYRFATYTGAKTESLTATANTIDWVMADKHHRLQLLARRSATSEVGVLKGPSTVEMGKRVAESLTAEVQVQLSEISGGVERAIFVGNGRCAGLEIHNVEAELLKAA